MGKIETLHTQLFNLVAGVTSFNQGFYEFPKEITDEKLPAYFVYLDHIENEISSNVTNKRTYVFAIDVVYDKESLDATQTVVSDLISSVLDVIEDNDNYSLSGNAHFVLPASVSRVESLEVGGKFYLGYHILLPVVYNTLIA